METKNLVSYPSRILKIELQFPLRMRSKIISPGQVSEHSLLLLETISNLKMFLTPWKNKDKKSLKNICRELTAPRILELKLQFPLRIWKQRLLEMFLKIPSYRKKIFLSCQFFWHLGKVKIKRVYQKKPGRTRIRTWVTAATTQCPNQ